MSLLLGIDVGTSSTKGLLTTPDGRIVARAERTHAVSNPRSGWYEQDADVWWSELVEISSELLTGGRAEEIVGVCCSGMGPCMLLADDRARPLRPAVLYGIDTRATAEIGELNDRLGPDTILERCGSPLTSQAVGPKLLWVQRNEPRVWELSERLLMPSSLAVLRLTGEYVLDHHSASQCAPLYDLQSADWADDWVRSVAPGLPLPRLLWPAEVAGHVTTAACRETMIPAGTPVAAGTIDAWAEAVSVGVRDVGDVMLMYGSTMFMIGLPETPRPDPRLWLTQWTTPGRHSRAAGLATSGLIMEWFAGLTSKALPDLTAEAASTPPGADGVVALPYFAGERTPLFDPDARGMLFGLQLGHGRGHLFRALLEATAYAVRHNFEVMADAGDSIGRIVAVGGGSRSSLWPQIVADVTGLDQQLPRETTGASYGDAWLAAAAADALESDDWSRIEESVKANPRACESYAPLYDVYRRLYDDTVGLAHQLARIQRVTPGACRPPSRGEPGAES